MTTLEEATALAREENGLAVISTLRADLTIQSSLVNAGALDHPSTGERVLAFVTYGKVKLGNLRTRPQVTATFRKGGQWATVEGEAQLMQPHDPQLWLDAERLRLLLREVFVAAAWRARGLGHVRPGDGRAGTYGGPHHPAPGVQQLTRGPWRGAVRS